MQSVHIHNGTERHGPFLAEEYMPSDVPRS